MALISVAREFESDGARKVADLEMEALEVAAEEARTASTVESQDTCRENVKSQGSPESLAEVAVVAEIASTAANLDTCLGTARNPRSQESLVVAAVVAETALTAASPATCPETVRSPESRESPRDLAADQEEKTERSYSLEKLRLLHFPIYENFV